MCYSLTHCSGYMKVVRLYSGDNWLQKAIILVPVINDERRLIGVVGRLDILRQNLNEKFVTIGERPLPSIQKKHKFICNVARPLYWFIKNRSLIISSISWHEGTIILQYAIVCLFMKSNAGYHTYLFTCVSSVRTFYGSINSAKMHSHKKNL
jgi:hypothetical protein